MVNTGLVFTQVCSPTFKEIYDFRVGDYFQYEYYSPDMCGECSVHNNYITTEFFTIKERRQNGDSILFTRTGEVVKALWHSSYNPWISYQNTLIINDTLISVDSVNHFLNKCPGDTIINNSIWNTYDSVQILQNECMLMKNHYSGWLIPHPPYYFDDLKESYARGLGLINLKDSYYNGEINKTLIGYIKASNTGALPEPIIINGDSVTICKDSKATLWANKSDSYKYQWFQNGVAIPGAVNDSLEVTDFGLYQVAESNGCMNTVASKPTLVQVHQPFYILTHNYNTIDCGESFKLSPHIMKYDDGYNSYEVFDSTLIYTWAADLTLSATNIKNPVARPINSRSYFLTVSDGICPDTASFNITLNPLVATIGEVAHDISCGDTIHLAVATNYTGTDTLKYNWNPSTGLSATNISNPVLTIGAYKNYTVQVQTPNGCLASDTVTISTSVTDFIPSICKVTVNDKDKNEVVWRKENIAGIDSCFIYRESTTQTGEYDLIGKLPYSSTGDFTDTASNARVQSNMYKIAVKDVCGFVTEMSAEHKTMHLTINKGTGNNWNLIWEQYIGVPVSGYWIYRGTTRTSLALIGVSSGSNTTYTDETAPAGDIYYQIGIILPQVCSNLKSTGIDSSRSNIVSSAEVIGIDPTSLTKTFIYPNPAFDKLTIKNVYSSDAIIAIYDLQGKLVLNKLIGSGQVDISNLPKGMYTVKLIDSGNVLINKLVKE